MTVKIKTNSPKETISLGEKIGARLRGGEIIAYRGDLGVGKTTITRGISLGMGLGDNVTSPTFALVNEYRPKARSGKTLSLIHFDMYRIASADDLETTGFFDYMDEDSVLCAEWSENIEEVLPRDAIVIEISRLSDNEREITINGDERFADIGN